MEKSNLSFLGIERDWGVYCSFATHLAVFLCDALMDKGTRGFPRM